MLCAFKIALYSPTNPIGVKSQLSLFMAAIKPSKRECFNGDKDLICFSNMFVKQTVSIGLIVSDLFSL
jgi:hypothetical protein